MYELASEAMNKARELGIGLELEDWIDMLENLRDLVEGDLAAARDDLRRRDG